MDKTSLGDRMKQYEAVPKTRLIRRMPVIIRLDGNAFHTWTKKIKRDDDAVDPFDQDMHDMMSITADYLTQRIQNAVFTYKQSDEISILLNDWKKLNTDAWFGNSVQKMTSISAGWASSVFNYAATQRGYIKWLGDLACFDSRVYNLPKEEVANYFIWRQQDWTRNSIQMLGRHYFSHKELHKKSTSEIQDMLMIQHGVNWNDLDVWKKRGACVVDNTKLYNSSTITKLDENIPIFTKDRNYIEQHLEAEKEQDSE